MSVTYMTVTSATAVAFHILNRLLTRLKNWIVWIIPILIIASIWQIVTQTKLVDERVLPSFAAVIAAWYDLIRSGQFFEPLILSLYRALTGLVVGSAVGIIVGISMARSLTIRAIINPFVTLTFPLPKTAFIPIVLLWLGVGNASIILVVFLGTLVPMVISTYHGAQTVYKELIWSAKTMGASRLRILTSIIFPASLPQILNGFRISLSFSLVIVISAEMVATTTGIGKFIFLYGESGNYNYMFATIIFVIGITFILDKCCILYSRRLLRWMDKKNIP